MGNRNAGDGRHLTPDEIESFALEMPVRPERAREHLDRCEACRTEVESLRSLDHALASLQQLTPSPGFATDVLARMRLPFPWRTRIWAGVRERKVSLVAALVAIVGTATAIGVWLANQPNVSIVGLFGLATQQIRDIALSGAIALGSALWQSTFVRSVLDGINAVGVEQAILVLAALSLVSIGAAGAMLRLLQPAPRRLGRTG